LIPTCPTLTKVLLQGSTRILIYIDGSLSHQTSPSCCYLTFFHIPERSIALVNDWLVHQKELKLIPTCPTLTKVLPVAHAFLYTLMDFFQSHNCAQAVAILPSSIFPNVQLHSSKRLAGSPKGAEIDPNLPHANKSVTPR
jgi:hypothetical protein